MSQVKLDRNPSILSCFPERFSVAGVQNSPQSSSNGSYLHDLSRPMTFVPQIPVDKHLVMKHQMLPRRTSSFGAMPLPSPPTDRKSSTIAAPPVAVDIPNKFESGPLPVPPPPLPSFLTVRNKTTSRLTLYAPLYQAAMKGDWEKANEFLRSHPGAVNVRITKEMDTVLHIAAGAKQTKFVEEVVKRMSIADLALRNKYNNTALCYAAASGVTKMAEMMVSKNGELLGIRNNKGVTPLYIAALFGHRDMVWYLYSVISDVDFTKEDSVGLLFATIKTDLFDVALSIIQKQPELAIHRDSNGETPLHFLARKPSVFASKSGLGAWQRFIYPWIYAEVPTNSHCPESIFQLHNCQPNQAAISLVGKLFRAIQVIVPGTKVLSEKKLMHIQALGLVKLLWEQVLLLDDAQVTEIITSPSNPLFTAAELGILEFITELIPSYPGLIWKVNEQSQSIFHIAVLQRQEKVFNLIHEIGAHKDMITSYKGINNHNILHLAGKLAPMDRLNIVSGAALQMQRELLWFKVLTTFIFPI
ncbi:ankyrin repeat-containing protein [Tripterygium wilfordii]|uniref:Ankyrin repeat-containing protein n=1 Tax=Tripterygium wilfordii TaxID=458696 RepID=A0A7J7D7P6_TRIWF|nr:ankyrin repeat-containing protein [Tripterygium wilfordii]